MSYRGSGHSNRDSVYFSDARSSLIDIVQAVGQALELNMERHQLNCIIIPAIINNNFGSDNNFENFFNVIQSLRDQDDIAVD